MSKEIARLLKDFSDGSSGKSPAPVPSFPFLKTVKLKPDLEPEALSEAKPTPAEDPKTLIRQAVERAREEEREYARKTMEQALAEELTRAEAAIQAARAEWVAREAEELKARIDAAFAALEERLSGRIANVLGPFVLEAFRQKALQGAQDTIRSLLSRSREGAIAISGPDDLLTAIKEALGESAVALEFKPSGGVDVTVIVGDTTIATQIDEWMARLNHILKAG